MKVIVDGLMTEYIDRGQGKIILVLHGWRSSSQAFDAIIKDLSKKYRVIAPDFPGFGGTEPPREMWDVARYTKWTQTFLTKLNIHDIYAVIGHSFGCRIMIKHQFGASKLVFLGPAGVKPKKTLRSRLMIIVAKIAGALGIKRFFAGKFGSVDYRATSGQMKEIFKKVINEDLSDSIVKIKTPSLIIWGRDDTETPVSDAKVFSKIKDSKLEILSDAGHYVFLDQPAQTQKLIQEFLKWKNTYPC